jgi:hypothetical protein
MADDSPLSIAANIIGIVTFVFGIAAAVYARWLWLKSRILLPYEMAEVYERVELNLADMSQLEHSMDFTPGEDVQMLIQDVYVDQTQVVHEMARFNKRSLFKRMSSADAARFSSLVNVMQTKMKMLRDWYMQEQMRAGFE